MHGDGDLDRPIALVQADISKLLPWAKANGITMALNATGSVEPAALCSNSAVVGMVRVLECCSFGIHYSLSVVAVNLSESQ